MEREVVPKHRAVRPFERAVLRFLQDALPVERAVRPFERAVVPSFGAGRPVERAVVPTSRAVRPFERAVLPLRFALPPKGRAVLPNLRAVRTATGPWCAMRGIAAPTIAVRGPDVRSVAARRTIPVAYPPTMLVDPDLLDRARAAAKVVAPLAQRIESERKLPVEAVRALSKAGLFKVHAPRAYGGSEASMATGFAMLEELGAADGSAGWCAMIGATSSLMAAFLDGDEAEAMYGSPDAVTSGVFAPVGVATRAPGGFRVTGRWPFSSGCEHSSWRMGGTIVTGGEPDLLPSGAPNVQCMMFPASDMRVIDTWDTSGLRGTGSHDVEVNDVFVPDSRSFSLLRDRPRHDAAVYRLPFFGILAVEISAVALGIARSAIDELIRLAQKKTPAGAKRSAAHRELVQLAVAEAEAKVSSARAFVREAVSEIEDSPEVTVRQRARLRLAACHATTEAAGAVDLMYEAGGASSVYTKSPLQRQFRDVHVATQHVMVSKTIAILAGRVLLGVESATEML